MSDGACAVVIVVCAVAVAATCVLLAPPAQPAVAATLKVTGEAPPPALVSMAYDTHGRLTGDEEVVALTLNIPAPPKGKHWVMVLRAEPGEAQPLPRLGDGVDRDAFTTDATAFRDWGADGAVTFGGKGVNNGQ